ncbi:hypothetical protein [Mycoplasma crocodyli]|uniref:Putative lipoprotein n=1 Tax=Mycoplasma crocodyli (strain ATCC 51981 / MP145) TaxID=512564 RepID=D5E6H0_MYCCM|nr:hypothetical protein [Mycoplasma crocodyli]ADE19850.1 putative lipoprotein [Mycoplasma crocodyli MP145]
MKNKKNKLLLVGSVLGLASMTTIVVSCGKNNNDTLKEKLDQLEKLQSTISPILNNTLFTKSSEIKEKDFDFKIDKTIFGIKDFSITNLKDDSLTINFSVFIISNPEKNFTTSKEITEIVKLIKQTLNEYINVVNADVQNKESIEITKVKIDDILLQIDKSSYSIDDAKITIINPITLNYSAFISYKENPNIKFNFTKEIKGFKIPNSDNIEAIKRNELKVAAQTIIVSVPSKASLKSNDVRERDLKIINFDNTKFNLYEKNIKTLSPSQIEFSAKLKFIDTKWDFEETVKVVISGFKEDKTDAQKLAELNSVSENIIADVESKHNKEAKTIQVNDVKLSNYNIANYEITNKSIKLISDREIEFSAKLKFKDPNEKHEVNITKKIVGFMVPESNIS